MDFGFGVIIGLIVGAVFGFCLCAVLMANEPYDDEPDPPEGF